MHLPSHLAISWLIGAKLSTRRDRVLVAWAGVAPDLDALSALWGEEAYGRWHHVLSHGAVSAVLLCGLCSLRAHQKLQVFLLSLVSFHMHLVCDLLGSGTVWPIVYLYPLSSHEFFTPYGWPLASWQNVTITAFAFLLIGRVALKRSATFAECFLPLSWDEKIVKTLQHRFGSKP
jgi:inner membrane protein